MGKYRDLLISAKHNNSGTVQAMPANHQKVQLRQRKI